MEEKIYTLTIRHTDPWRYEVTIPETGVTKTSPTIDCILLLYTIFSSISQRVNSSWSSLINISMNRPGSPPPLNGRKPMESNGPPLRLSNWVLPRR